MNTTHDSPRFDWIGWLTTIPGIPAGWGQADDAAPNAPSSALADEDMPFDDGPPILKAA